MATDSPESPQLQRSLSLPLVTFYGIGTILGAGIYVLVGKVAGYAGMLTPFAFLIAALLAAFSAFSYAELSARFPKSAGEAVYVQEGLGWRRLSIVVGVSIAFIGTISVATLVHGFVGYAQLYVDLPDTFIIVTLTLAMGAVVAWGISESVLAASLMTVVEMAGLVIIIWIARDSFSQLPEHLPEMLPGLEFPIWQGVLLGSFVAFYAFLGFEDIVNVAEEVRDPQRNLPRAIILALVITTLFYLLVTTVSVLSMAPVRLAQSDAPLAMLYSDITGRSPDIITLISLVSIVNGAIIQLIMASRVLYGMSRQGWITPRLGRVNAKTHTPLLATALVTASVLLFALWLPLLSLAKLTSLFILMVFCLINLSLWRVKVRAPLPEGIRTIPLWVPVTGLVVSVGFLSFQIINALLA
jgi:APA family basic amino acid/polyamine antiporter